MLKQKQTGKARQDPAKTRKTGLVSGEEAQTLSIYEQRLNEIDPDVVEKELRELVLEIEATNAKLKKLKAITHETLKLVVSL
jgi:hypothetical protein